MPGPLDRDSIFNSPEWQAFELEDKISELNTATAFEETAKRQIDAEREKQQAFRDTWTLLQAFYTAFGMQTVNVKIPEVTPVYTPPDHSKDPGYTPPSGYRGLKKGLKDKYGITLGEE